MALAFSTEVVNETENVVEAVFSRPVALRNEAEKEAAPIPAGQLAILANYRGFNKSGKGKKARGAGEAVLDLSAVSRIPARELPTLIASLKELQASMDAGIAQAEAM